MATGSWIVPDLGDWNMPRRHLSSCKNWDTPVLAGMQPVGCDACHLPVHVEFFAYPTVFWDVAGQLFKGQNGSAWDAATPSLQTPNPARTEPPQTYNV